MKTRHPARTSVPHRERQRLETHRRVFEAALEIFIRDGVAPARIEDITSRASVSRGTFYFHFPTKEDVLVELLVQSEQSFVQAVEALPEEVPPQEIFAAVARFLAQRWSSQPTLFAEVCVVALRRAAAQITLAPAEGIRACLARRFELAAGRVELRAHPPAQVLADLYLANVFAVGIAWSTQPFLALEDALQASALLFLDGARSRS